MALDPRIALAGRVPDIGQTFTNVLQNVQRIDALKESRDPTSLTNRLLEAQLSGAEAGTQEQEQKNRIRSIATFGAELAPDIQSGNLEAIRAKTERRISQDLPAQGLPSNDSQELLTVIDNPNLTREQKLQQIGQLSSQAIQLGQQTGVLERPTAATRDKFIGTPVRVERGGQTFLSGIVQKPDGSFTREDVPLSGELVSTLGETAAEQTQRAVLEAGGTEAAKLEQKLKTEPTIAATTKAAEAAITRSEKAFDQINKIKENVVNLDEVIRLVNEGAETGVIASKLPSIRSASIQLDNLQGRLGLDVIGNTTFGALSESELKFALDTALPKKLEGQDLIRWVERKKDAQLKLSGYLTEVATFLGTPGNTTADFIELQKVRQIEREQGIEKAPQSATAPTTAPTVEPATSVTNLSDEELFNF